MTEEELVRHKKLNDLRAVKVDPYPSVSNRSIFCREIADKFDDLLANQKTVTAVGRVRTIRHHGGLSFATIEDQSGQIQIAFKKNEVGESEFENWKNMF